MNSLSKVSVPRSQWLRGETSNNSSLFDPARNKGCCLGHALSQICKVPIASLAMYTTPAMVAHKVPVVPMGLVKVSSEGITQNSAKCNILMQINDDDTMDDDTRERLLTEGGVEVGIAFEFVG